MLIQVDKWDYFKNRPQDFFLFYIYLFFFLKYETIVRSSAWSFGHSDPDPSSVLRFSYFGSYQILCINVTHREYREEEKIQLFNK